MIVPDFLRIVRPLGSFGLTTNADGRIYDVQGPFAEERIAGLEGGPQGRRPARSRGHALRHDRQPRSAPAIWPCGAASTMSCLGARRRLLVAAARESPGARDHARRRAAPRQWLLDAVVVLARIAGVLVVLGAAWLVWTRPGADDLGLLRLCDPVQSRPGVPVLRLPAAMAVGASSRRTSPPASCRPRATRDCCCLRCGRRSTNAKGGGVQSSAPCPRSSSCSSRSRSRVSEAPSAILPSSPCGLRS